MSLILLCQFTAQHVSDVNTPMFRSIQHKIKVNNAMITQAVKGRMLVIIYREDYHKVQTFLTNNNFQTIPKNPTNIYHKQITQTIKQCNLVFHNEQCKYITVRNPNPPTLVAQIKLNKDSNPISPVINNIRSFIQRCQKA